ncbi:MAG: hypothetical protein LBE49_01295 [Deltaproteobacteria bacterium]|nr:hypothetical protein [Deltaproteobacteria bacterium]
MAQIPPPPPPPPSKGPLPFGFVLLPLVILVIGLLTSIPYAFAIFYNPFIYISVLVTLAWGEILGRVGGRMLGFCGIANPFIAIFLVLIAGIPAFLLHWAVYYTLIVYRLNEVSYFSMEGYASILQYLADKAQMVIGAIANYQGTLADLKTLSQEGMWTIDDNEVKGTVLLAIWGLEFLFFFFSLLRGFWRGATRS